jgi:flagellar basal-body rod protein FlgB
MTIENIALFKALGAKMEFLAQRQRVIAQNIANADTPDYKPQDLKPVNFDSVLKKAAGESRTTSSVIMASTSPQHMGGANDIGNAKEARQKKTYEVAPAGNAVIMEEQMINSNQTAMDYNMITSLYQKNVRMIRSALGVQG